MAMFHEYAPWEKPLFVMGAVAAVAASVYFVFAAPLGF